MTLAVKYCGGCNPRFDRVAMVRRLCEEFPQLAPAASPADIALIVCGCPACCADHSELTGAKAKFVVASPEDFAAARDAIRHILEAE